MAARRRKATKRRLRVPADYWRDAAVGKGALVRFIPPVGCGEMQHYDVLWTRMKTQKSKRWQDGAQAAPKNYFVYFNLMLQQARRHLSSSLLS